MADASYGKPPPREEEAESDLFHGLRTWLRHLRRPRNGDSVRESIEELIDESEPGEEEIDPQERLLIGNILKLHAENVADVMVQRVDIVAVDVETPFDELVRIVIEQAHSRYPVYRETLDDVIGIVHIKDILPYVADRRPVKLQNLVRKVLFVAPSIPVLDLLLQMRLSRTHMAMVIDEFGGIDGLVTIEDLIEEIVGEIEDEHDDADAPKIIERADGTLIADARTKIEDFEQRLGQPVLPPDAEEEVDTLGGLVFTLAGRVPQRGEIITHPLGIAFEVLDADPRRVKRLRIRGLPPAAPAAPAASNG